MLLKASKKFNLNKKLYLYSSLYQLIQNQKFFYLLLNTNAHFQSHIGVLQLNKEHRYNTLTPAYVKDVQRGLTTLYQDDIVKMIILHGQNSQHFSNGTDFRTLLHYKQHNKKDEVTQYLEDLYGLQIFTAKINKPLVAVAHGHSFNSGATFLQATGIPSSTPNSKIAFNEVQFGFVPHSGATYYLSRLPGELGTFLALTGMHMTGVDAVELGIADQFIHYAKNYALDMQNAFRHFDTPIPSVYHLSDNGRFDDWNQYLQMRREYMDTNIENDITEMHRNRQEDGQYNPEFYEPRDRKPKLGRADFLYKKMMKEYNRIHYADPEKVDISYLEFDRLPYQNYFSYVADKVKNMSGNQYDRNDEGVHKHLKEIDRCFYPNNLEEIIENLKKENTVWSKAVLEQMDKNSTLSMKLALRMMREARNLDYKGCMRNEINVALNKIEDSEFDLGISQVLLKPGKDGLRPRFSKDVPKDKVESFFEKNKMTDAVQLNVVENALLPNRFYYQDYADASRLWLNEISTPQDEIRGYFEVELKNNLRALGIDIRDRALTIESARSQIYKKEMTDRNIKVHQERLKSFFTDDKLKDTYYSKARKEVSDLKNNPQLFYEIVNKKIQQVFENAFIERLDKIYQKSKEAQSLEKRRMFLRLKKFMFSSRLLTFATKEFDKIGKKLDSLTFKEVHLTENWEKSFIHQEHPELKRTILYHLAKVVGRKTLSPLELAKSYITDPQQAKRQTFLTFDKNELLALRRDILENPEKYELMLTKHDNGTFKRNWDENDRQFGVRQLRLEEYNYWYRILNEGYNPWDNVKDYQTMLAYQEFVEKIERKALDTLKFCVQKLINDFDDIKEIKEFSEQERESKRQSFSRLISMIYDQQPPQKEKKKLRVKEEAKLIEQRRPLKDIESTVNHLLQSDPVISKVLPLAEGTEGHPLVNKLRDSLKQDLLNLLEIVLLNQDPNYPLTKEVLEQRLAAITNPANKEAANVTQLRFLDQYLHQHNAEQTIKNAIEMVKPFFYSQILNKINSEAQRVLDAFRFHKTGEELLFLYELERNHPDYFRSDTYKRLTEYHAEIDRQEYLDRVFPVESANYHRKQLLSQLSTRVPAKASIEEQEAALEANVREQLKEIEQFERKQEKIVEDARKDIEKYRELQAKKPLDKEDIPNEDGELEGMHVDPQHDFYHFRNFAEMDQLDSHIEEIERLHQRFQEYGTDLMNEIGPLEAMQIIWGLFTQHGYQMHRIFRYCYEPKKFAEIDFEKEMRNMFGGSPNLTFEELGHYAGFLKDIYQEFSTSTLSIDQQENYDFVLDEVVKLTQNLDEYSQSSIFEQLLKDKQSVIQTLGAQNEELRQEVRDFKDLIASVDRQRVLKENIAKYLNEDSSVIPESVRNQIKGVLSSDSKYLRLDKFDELLAQIKSAQSQKDRNHLISQFKFDIINKDMLVKDLQQGKLIPQFLQNYNEVPLDVVSLAQTKTMIEEAKSDEILTDRLKAQISLILDFISDQLKYLPNERRKAMKLGEFMKRHQFLNSPQNGQFSQFADVILQNKIKQTLGQIINQDKDFDTIDWEYATYRTNPASHENKDEKVLEAWSKNNQVSSLNEKQEIEKIFDAELLPLAQNEQSNLLQQKKNPNHQIIKNVVEGVDPETGEYFVKDESEYALEEILKDAKDYAQLKPEFDHIRNQYENQILNLYIDEEFRQQDLQDTIERYTNLRLNDLLLQDSFRQKLKSNNGHIYLKVLREEIINELNLNKENEPQDLAYHKLFDERLEYFKAEAEARYNLSSLINDEAVGYDNIEERAADPQNNRELAHQTMFDKLLSEYFSSKRKAFTNVNQLVDRINEQFQDNNGYKPGHPSFTKDQGIEDPTIFPISGDPKITYKKLQQDITKDTTPHLRPTDFVDFMELDVTVSQALQNDKNGLSINLRKEIPEEFYTVPDYYEQFDPRKPITEYVDDKLTIIIDELFQMRKKLEKTFSRKELLAYDKLLIKHLTLETLIPKLEQEVESDYNMAVQGGQAVDAFKEGEKENNFIQMIKQRKRQAEENRAIKDENALYKFLTYSAMLEKNRRANLRQVYRDEKIPYEIHSFDEYYKEQLLKDSKRPPRPVNEEDYLEPNKLSQKDPSAGFMTQKESMAAYFDQYPKYIENKKETIERNQTYFILEQLRDKTLQSQEPLNEAQNAILEYFNDPENTKFFNKNKIQFENQ